MKKKNNKNLKTFILVENESYGKKDFFLINEDEFSNFISLIKDEQNKQDKKLFEIDDDKTIKAQFCGLFSFENTYILVFPKIFNHMKFKHNDFKIIFKTIVKYLNNNNNVIKVGKYEYDNSSKQDPEYNYFWRFILADKIVNLYNKYGLVFPLIKKEITNNWSNVDWNKTISKSLIYLDNNNFPIFDKVISHKLDENTKHFIAEIHAMILNEIYQLRSLLSEPNAPFIYNVKQFLNREKVYYYINVLNQELWKTNIEWKREVFNLLIDYLEGKYLKSKNKIWIAAGSKLFDAIWQKACEDVYGNHLNNEISNHSILLRKFKKRKCIKDIFIKNQYPTIQPSIQNKNDDTKPDQILVFDKVKKIFILDAKNYKSFEDTNKEIYKQYVYSFYFYNLLSKKFKKNTRILIFNCFLIPHTDEPKDDNWNIIDWKKVELPFFNNSSNHKNLNILWKFQISMIKTFEHYLSKNNKTIDLSNFDPKKLQNNNKKKAQK